MKGRLGPTGAAADFLSCPNLDHKGRLQPSISIRLVTAWLPKMGSVGGRRRVRSGLCADFPASWGRYRETTNLRHCL